jgi:hypothetical protein
MRIRSTLSANAAVTANRRAFFSAGSNRVISEGNDGPPDGCGPADADRAIVGEDTLTGRCVVLEIQEGLTDHPDERLPAMAECKGDRAQGKPVNEIRCAVDRIGAHT